MGFTDESRPLTPDDYRKRYHELKASAARLSRERPAAARVANPVTLAPDQILLEETIPGGWYWARHIPRGQTLRIVNAGGSQGVSALFWNAQDTSERLNVADTVKVQWTARIGTGHVLLSDMGRAMASITDDTCGYHDCIVGGSTPDGAARKYGPDSSQGRNSQTNFILAAAKHGMDIRDVGPCITFFAPVVMDETGRFVWQNGVVAPGMYVDLRAEMDLIVALSNCPHPLGPVAAFQTAPVKVVVWQSPPPGADDFCRNAGDEAARAFENTEAMLKAGGAQ
ncbi:MAG: urea amidolyase associated protein UAAP1 [Rhizomicrobium sp.]